MQLNNSPLKQENDFTVVRQCQRHKKNVVQIHLEKKDILNDDNTFSYVTLTQYSFKNNNVTLFHEHQIETSQECDLD